MTVTGRDWLELVRTVIAVRRLPAPAYAALVYAAALVCPAVAAVHHHRLVAPCIPPRQA